MRFGSSFIAAAATPQPNQLPSDDHEHRAVERRLRDQVLIRQDQHRGDEQIRHRVRHRVHRAVVAVRRQLHRLVSSTPSQRVARRSRRAATADDSRVRAFARSRSRRVASSRRRVVATRARVSIRVLFDARRFATRRMHFFFDSTNRNKHGARRRARGGRPRARRSQRVGQLNHDDSVIFFLARRRKVNNVE